jgi:carboxymethylenebutenolidase
MTVRLASSDGFECPAYVAQPAGKPKAGLVVLQEIFGVNSHIREVADGYAAEGYLVVAPATFHRVKHGVELGYTADDMQAGFALKQGVEGLPAPGVMADIQAAVEYAAKTSGGKVGVVGYCWGGLLTWRAAEQVKGVSAAVPYYGGGSTSAEERARQPHCPVMMHLSDCDDYVPMDSLPAFKQAHPEVEMHMYSARHGFNCDHRGAYDEASAKLAKQRTLAFFAKHLG